MQNITTMIESGSVVLLSVVIISHIESRLAHSPRLRAVALGLLFALVGVVVMENSVEIVPGIRTDPRAAVVTMAAAFGGPLGALITTPLLALLRLSYGGIGAAPGVIYILGIGILSSAIWYGWFRIWQRPFDLRYVVVQAAAAGLGPTVILLFASNAPWEVFLTANALAAPTNFFTALLMGTMVARDRERNSALADRLEAHARIDNTAENAPVILFQLVRGPDSRPKFEYVSKGAQRILGVRPDVLAADFGVLRSVAGAAAVDQIDERLRVSAASGAPWSLELECVRPDGGVVYVKIDAGVRTDATGRPVWEGSICDVSEQKRIERMKDDFVATVSHELRTPLTSLRGSLGLVMATASAELSPKAHRMLHIANRNAERLVLLINDILDVQKIHSGQMRFELTEQEARPLVEQAVASAQSYAPEKRIRFALTDDAPLGRIDIDPDRLNQVLSNLLSNAIKFSPEDGTIIVSMRHVRGHLRISVSDEGPGIPEEFRSKIFDRFSQAQTSSTRVIGGTGLGLNISKALVEAMNGTLTFDSVEGRGATFHIDLPSPSGVVRVPLNGPITLAERRILSCCSDPAMNQQIRESLAGSRLMLDTAPDIETVMTLAAGRAYAALVVDASSMPLPDLFMQVRTNSRIRDLPVILVAGEPAQQLELVSGATAGVVDWLGKPLDGGQLQNAIERALSAVSQGRPRILYVEDDRHLREIIRLNLDESVTVIGAGDLNSAREKIATTEFDMVLLDLDLPDGFGVDLLGEIPDDLPVIIFSALEVSPDVVNRVIRVLLKSRVKETDVAQAVLAALSQKAADRQGKVRVA